MQTHVQNRKVRANEHCDNANFASSLLDCSCLESSCIVHGDRQSRAADDAAAREIHNIAKGFAKTRERSCEHKGHGRCHLRSQLLSHF